MKIKKWNLFWLNLLGIFFFSKAYSQSSFGEMIQINTDLSSFIGRPSWTLIIRDVQTGQVLPYLFDFYTEQNFWIAFTAGHSYRIMASNLKFGPYATISNFCHLENGVLNGESFIVTLKGQLSPDPCSYTCTVRKYKNLVSMNSNMRFQ